MVVGDQEALAAMVVPVKKCLSDPSVEVRSYAAVLLEAILAKCATHECAYLEDLLTGLLCEALGREESPRVHGRLSKVACEAVNRSQEHSDYEKVRRLLGALNPSEPSDLASRGISAQRAAILGQLLEMQFFDLVVEDLISGDAFRESAAGFVLASFKEMVVPRAVQAVCESEDVRVQTALLPILKSQPATTLAHVKERMTAGGGPGELKRMIGLAAKMLPEGQEILSLALEQPEEVVATEAVRAMAHLPPDECVRALVGLLTHPRSAVCREALRQIGELRLTDVEGDVNRMVSSDSVELASEACKTLGLIGTAESVSTLCKALRSRGFLGFFGGLSPVVRAAAASALGQIGTPHALADLQRAARERNAMVRESAKSALESFGRREDRPQGRGDPGTSL